VELEKTQEKYPRFGNFSSISISWFFKHILDNITTAS